LGRAVGLDIGARHVRLVEADGGARGIRVVRLGEREIVVPEGAEREEGVREAVDALLKETRAPRDEVVLAWPAEGCTIREITVPFREADAIRKVAKFEFESHLHASAIDDVVMDYFPLGETREGTRLLCFAASKAPLRARLAALLAARVEPIAVDLDVGTLAAAATAAGVLAETPNCVLADRGARSTKIVIVVDGAIRAARAFLTGSDETAVPAPEAAVVAAGATAEPSSGTALTAPRQDAATRLAREITRTIANAAPDAGLTCVWIAGRGALDAGLRADLAAHLGFEVRFLDLFARIPNPVPAENIEEASAVYANALGAAARGLGLGPMTVDLRREDLSYARRFDQVKKPLAAGLAFLLLGLGFLLWRARAEKDASQEEFRTMSATLLATSKSVEDSFRKELGDSEWKKIYAGTDEPLNLVPESKRRAGQMHDHLRNQLGLSTEVPPIRSGLESFRIVNEAIKKVRDQIDYCLVVTENYTQKEATLQVVLLQPEKADVLLSAFREAKWIDGSPLCPKTEDASYGTIKEDSKGRYSVSFTLRFEKSEKK
jgi:Tfp pilus assembly PilM family ATPase